MLWTDNVVKSVLFEYHGLKIVTEAVLTEFVVALVDCEDLIGVDIFIANGASQSFSVILLDLVFV
jgi:hypothetical protein